jgi:hypothetical protein
MRARCPARDNDALGRRFAARGEIHRHNSGRRLRDSQNGRHLCCGARVGVSNEAAITKSVAAEPRRAGKAPVMDAAVNALAVSAATPTPNDEARVTAMTPALITSLSLRVMGPSPLNSPSNFAIRRMVCMHAPSAGLPDPTNEWPVGTL